MKERLKGIGTWLKNRCKGLGAWLKRRTFYKKKRFYLVLTILFSLLLLADLMIGLFVPTQTTGMGRGAMQFDSAEMETDGTEDADEGSMQMRGGGGRGQMSEQSGDADGNGMQMPDQGANDADGSDAENSDTDSGDASDGMPQFDESEMGDMELPDDADMSDIMGDMGFDSDAEQSVSFLQRVKSCWVVLLIVFALLDAGSIFMLVWISKKEKKREMERLRAEMEATGEVHILRKSVVHKKSSPLVWLIPVAGVAILVIVIQMMTGRTSDSTSQTEATVYSETAALSSISTILPGAGTLAEETAQTLDLPEDVEITTWYVSDGDTVEAGDKLAKVDQVSVMSAIASVQEKLTALDTELAEHADDTVSEMITAAADGRVKVIYASAGTGVADTMYTNGSLMRISLDGYMAVSITTDESLSAGDSVTVTLSDSTAVSGKVDSVTGGTAVITVTDAGTTYGDTVSVYAEDGTLLGSGTLYIHSELLVTGYTGTVSAVNVSEDEEISSGDTLLTLTDTDYTAEYELLIAQREALTEQLKTLFTLLQEEYVYAEYAGVISGLGDVTTTSSDSDGADSDSETTVGAAVSEAVSIAANTTDESEAAASVSSGTVSVGGAASAGAAVCTVSCRMADAQTAATASTMTYHTGGAATGVSLSAVTEENSAITDLTATGATAGAAADIGTATRAEDSLTSGLASSRLGEVAYVYYLGTVSAVDGAALTIYVLPDAYELTETETLDEAINEEALAEQTVLHVWTLTITEDVEVYAYTDGAWVCTTVADIQEGDILALVYADGASVEETAPLWIIRVTEELLAQPKEETEDGQQDNNSATEGADADDGSSAQNSSSTENAQQSGEASQSAGASQSADMPQSADASQSSDAAQDVQSTWAQDTATAQGDASGSASEETFSENSMASDTAQGGDTDAAAESSAASDSAAEQEISETYGVSETTWLSITPQETMDISITVDEMDILSLEVGMEAEVTLDAFPGQSFDGTVTSVDTSGTNAGGTSKYTAIVTIAREEDMLVGMNASVKITLETTDCVLAIPVAALVEDETGVYVYTSYDADTDTLGDLVEVTTGISDGENVEITSGLSEGSTYCYSYLDTVNYSSAFSSSGGGSFSFDSLFGGSSQMGGGRN